MTLPLRVFVAVLVVPMLLVALVCVVPIPASVVSAEQRQPKHSTAPVIKGS